MENTEVVADSAVEIAQINADRDVNIEAIRATTDAARIEAAVDHQEDMGWLRGRISSLETELALSQEEVRRLSTPLLEQPLLEATTEDLAEAITEAVEEAETIELSTPLDTSASTTETPTDHTPENVVVEEVEAVPHPARHRPIIQLV